MAHTVYIAGPMSEYKDTDWNFPAFHAAAERWRRAGWHVSNPAENFDGRTDLPYGVYIREAVTQVARADAIALLPGWERSRGAKLEALIASMIGLDFYAAETMGRILKPSLQVLFTHPSEEEAEDVRVADLHVALSAINGFPLKTGSDGSAAIGSSYFGLSEPVEPAPPQAVPSDRKTAYADFGVLDKFGKQTILEEAQSLVYGDREAAYSHPYDDFARIAGVWGSYIGCAITPLDVAMLMAMLKVCRVKVDIDHFRPPKRDSLVDLAGYAECGNRVAERMAEMATRGDS